MGKIKIDKNSSMISSTSKGTTVEGRDNVTYYILYMLYNIIIYYFVIYLYY